MKRVFLLLTLLVCLLAGLVPAKGAVEEGQPGAGREQPSRRIVSLVPALTEMLFAIGAGSRVVGVSTFDSFPSEVQKLPRVGALLDPDTERILALRPDLVLVYGSQNDARASFERAGIRTYSYRHGGLATIVASIEDLGRLTGQREQAARAADNLRTGLAGIRAKVATARRPKTLLVVERQAGTLRGMYVSGGSGFLNEVLETAGAVNVFADVKQESVQPSHEMLLARAPEVIIEVRARGLDHAAGEERTAWSVLPALPAVRTGRVHLLFGEHLVVPGPRLAAGAEAMARALHPEVFTKR